MTIENSMQDQPESWLVRLSSDQVSELDMQQFSLWLAESEQHRHCFDQVFSDWQALSVVKELPFDLDAIMSEANAASRSANPPGTPNTVTTLSSRRRKWSIMGLAASALLAVVLLPQWIGSNKVDSQHYQSGIGEQRSLELADGSVVKLNTNTRLTVSYTKQQRQITLSRGEAFFDVARDSERPFTVHSCETEARALGTAFNVRCELQQGAVTVTEGTVQVTDLRGGQNKMGEDKQHILMPGQQLAIAESGDFAMPVSVEDDSATCWRNGELVFNGATLREVITEITRYTSRKILIASPVLAATKVTGRFEIQDAEALLIAMQDSLKMEVVSQPSGNLLLKKALL